MNETNDELMKRAREWLQSCVNAATRSGVPEEADLEAFILAHIDGEPLRQAKALAAAQDENRRLLLELENDAARLAAAREEQRETCAVKVDWWGPTLRPVAEDVRDTPLDATPLADELRTLRAALERANEGVRYWTDLAQAEARDAAALRARVAELEALAEKAERERNELRTWVSAVAEALGAIEPVSDCRVELGAEGAAAAADALRARAEKVEADLAAMMEQWKAELNHANAWMRKCQAAEAQVAASHHLMTMLALQLQTGEHDKEGEQ